MSNLSVLVVYQKKLEREGRRTEAEIGRVTGHRASLNSEKEFKSRQFEIPTTQPVVFVGRSRYAEQIWDICPDVFSKRGAQCRIGGKRAILDCAWPTGLLPSEAPGQALELAVAIQELTGQQGGFTRAERMEEIARAKRGAPGVKWVEPIPGGRLARQGAKSTSDFLRDRALRDGYVELLYLYAASRFVAEHLDGFAEAT